MSKSPKPYDWQKDKSARKDLRSNRQPQAKDVRENANVLRGMIFGR